MGHVYKPAHTVYMDIHENIIKQTDKRHKDPEACGEKSGDGASKAQTDGTAFPVCSNCWCPPVLQTF